MPQISIISSVYNVELYIKQCYECLIKQDLTDWEWLVYDDCSTDKTLFELELIANKDNRVKIIKGEQNRGSSYGRNICLEKAQGEYIAIQDGDDLSTPTRFSLQLKFLNENVEYSWVSGSMQLFDNHGNYAIWTKPKIPSKWDCMYDIPSLHAATMFRKEVLKSANGYRIAKETKRGQDYDLFLRLFSEGYRGYNLEEILYLYRRDRTSFYQRSLQLCFNECVIRWKNFRNLGIYPLGLIFVVKPLMSILLPGKLASKLKWWLKGTKER